MGKCLKRKSLLVAPQDEPYVAGLINKVQQQLSAIGNKLDILISQSSKKPFEKSYSQKASQRSNYLHSHDRGRQGGDGRYDRGPREMHKAACAECKKECEVPFKPSGDRPVYCRECFSKCKKDNPFNASRENRPEKRDFPREHNSDKRQDGKRKKPAKKKELFFARRKKRA